MIHNFSQTILLFNHDALRTASLVRSIESTAFIILAKIDHMLFKGLAYNAVYLRNANQAFSDHHDCRLGQWYESGDGNKFFSHLPSYKGLLQPHQQVHDTIGDIGKVLEDMNHLAEQRDVLLKFFTEMENASYQLFQTMDTLLRESGQKEVS
jgi:methyl-accepting chemotaxis protein